MASTDSETLTGRSPAAPGDFYVRNGGALRVTSKADQAGAVVPAAVSLILATDGNVGSSTALSVYVEPNSGDVNPTSVTLTGIRLYMEDIGSASVNHLIGIDIGMNSSNTADDWHTFFRIKGHSGTAKSIFKINAAATYLFDFQGADTAAPLNAGYTTLTCRMPDGSSRTIALS